MLILNHEYINKIQFHFLWPNHFASFSKRKPFGCYLKYIYYRPSVKSCNVYYIVECLIYLALLLTFLHF